MGSASAVTSGNALGTGHLHKTPEMLMHRLERVSAPRSPEPLKPTGRATIDLGGNIDATRSQQWEIYWKPPPHSRSFPSEPIPVLFVSDRVRQMVYELPRLDYPWSWTETDWTLSSACTETSYLDMTGSEENAKTFPWKQGSIMGGRLSIKANFFKQQKKRWGKKVRVWVWNSKNNIFGLRKNY